MSNTEASVEMGKNLNGVIKIDASQIHSHLDSMVRSTVEEMLNKLLDEEADRLCNAARYEHNDTRTDTRAGHYTRTFHARAGMLNLKIPKLRKATFETAIIERYRRREASVEEALIEMYLAGVSVRRIEDITEALWGTRVSPGTISELNKKIYAQIELWRNRPLTGPYAYIYLDGIYLKRSWGVSARRSTPLQKIYAASLSADFLRFFQLPGSRSSILSAGCVLTRRSTSSKYANGSISFNLQPATRL